MLVLTPRVSEKAYGLHQNGTYVFNVPMSANKAEVVKALKEQYGVDAKDVRLVVQNGKPVRTVRNKRQMPTTNLRTKTKKAYVSLVEGASLNLFNEEGEEKK